MGVRRTRDLPFDQLTEVVLHRCLVYPVATRRSLERWARRGRPVEPAEGGVWLELILTGGSVRTETTTRLSFEDTLRQLTEAFEPHGIPVRTEVEEVFTKADSVTR